jgi:hypothetical protein
MKINSTIYKKLVLQAEEAKDQQLIKLADGILGAVGAVPNDEQIEYSYSQLQNDIYQDMWKIATRLIYYHDLQSVNAEKLGKDLEAYAAEILEQLELNFGVDDVIKSSVEPKLLGENK